MDEKWRTQWASESCMSVDKCTRTVGGVRIPHAVCVHHLRYVYTHAHFLRCLYTYGSSLTGIDQWRRSDAIATLGDGVCTLTARPDGMPTRRDGLPAHRDGVCTQKCDNPRTSTCLYDILKAARTWLFPLGLYMLVRALVRMFHTGLSNILFQFELMYSRPRYIYLFYSFFITRCVRNVGLHCRIYFSNMKDILNLYLL